MWHQRQEFLDHALAEIVGGKHHREADHQAKQCRIQEGTAHDPADISLFRMLIGHMHPNGIHGTA
ncbi:hypothetical protein D3C75_1207960 [compost metagenome]